MESPTTRGRDLSDRRRSMLKKNRTDGTGWDWCWADWQRDWMDATPHRYAYRCLPLTIMNQTGWWIKNPVGFTATWRGQREPGDIDFRFDAAAETLGEMDQQPVRRGNHHVEHAVSFSHETGGLASPDLRPRQLLQDQCPSALRADRERLDQHVVHDELENHGSEPTRPIRAWRTALPGDSAGEQRLRGPGRCIGLLSEAE